MIESLDILVTDRERERGGGASIVKKNNESRKKLKRPVRRLAAGKKKELCRNSHWFYSRAAHTRIAPLYLCRSRGSLLITLSRSV
jgi:hypothetical protein